jgi:hypothetical protein
MSRSLAFGFALLTTTVIAACTLYQSPDRDTFNRTATAKTSSLTASPEESPADAPKLAAGSMGDEFCRSWIPKDAAAQVLSVAQISVEAVPDSTQTCRISYADDSLFPLLCTVAPDARLLAAEGLDLTRSPSALSVSGGTSASSGPARLNVARKLNDGQAIVCKTIFASAADLNENLALLGVRTNALIDLLAIRLGSR